MQQRYVGDRLTTVGEHHGQVDGVLAWIVAGAARAQPTQSVAEGVREAGGVGETGRQPGSGVADHPAPVGGDDEPGA
ncbi:hypothetical protein [Kitasatospora sp. MBT66]|uniref:hypothetical protein n=1 Tax=Kitasatospora sp. MBT66 TaxID=1444769 RepID=UPI00068D997B|nr:hypothetical protein [Kitasatospora sp. MBT66]